MLWAMAESKAVRSAPVWPPEMIRSLVMSGSLIVPVSRQPAHAEAAAGAVTAGDQIRSGHQRGKLGCQRVSRERRKESASAVPTFAGHDA
jgi:hypothetical protein